MKYGQRKLLVMFIVWRENVFKVLAWLLPTFTFFPGGLKIEARKWLYSDIPDLLMGLSEKSRHYWTIESSLQGKLSVQTEWKYIGSVDAGHLHYHYLCCLSR